MNKHMYIDNDTCIYIYIKYMQASITLRSITVHWIRLHYIYTHTHIYIYAQPPPRTHHKTVYTDIFFKSIHFHTAIHQWESTNMLTPPSPTPLSMTKRLSFPTLHVVLKAQLMRLPEKSHWTRTGIDCHWSYYWLFWFYVQSFASVKQEHYRFFVFVKRFFLFTNSRSDHDIIFVIEKFPCSKLANTNCSR